jgi:hypothetical protein
MENPSLNGWFGGTPISGTQLTSQALESCLQVPQHIPRRPFGSRSLSWPHSIPARRVSTGWCPQVISWFINPFNYRCITYIP